MSGTSKLYKAACGLNLAVLLRALRFGPKDVVRKVVLEIGTYDAATTQLIALNLPRARIHTPDLPLDISSEEDRKCR